MIFLDHVPNYGPDDLCLSADMLGKECLVLPPSSGAPIQYVSGLPRRVEKKFAPPPSCVI